jgi:hypothetical protein
MGNSEFVYGFKPYEAFETGIRKMHSQITKVEYNKDWTALFERYPTLTLREYSELSNQEMQIANSILISLESIGMVFKFSTKNGDIWIKK